MRMRALTIALCACLAVAAVLAVAAGAATDGKYKGKTAQKKRVAFTIGGNTITGLRFAINLKCSNGDTLTDDESDFEPIDLDAAGKFSDEQVGGKDQVKLSGKVKGSTVKGRVRVQDKLKKGVTCKRAVKFKAKRTKSKKK
jgi:hypothetical protein